MTDDTGGAAPPPTWNADVENTFDRLLSAAEAARLIIGIAKIIPDTARHKPATPSEMFEIWRATNLVVQTAFDRLFTEVITVDACLRPSSPLYSG